MILALTEITPFVGENNQLISKDGKLRSVFIVADLIVITYAKWAIYVV